MKKILSLLVISSFITMTTLNTVACNKMNSQTKTVPFKNNTFVLGDSLSDGGALSNIGDALFNDPWVQTQDLKSVLPSFVKVLGNGLFPSSILSSVPSGFDIQQLMESLQHNNKINKIQVEGDDNYMHNSYQDSAGNSYEGISFSNSDTLASLLIKHYDNQLTPAWDSNIEKIKMTGNNGDQYNLVNSLNGNNYAVGGATAHTPDLTGVGYFQDSILYQAKALIEHHNDLSNSLVSLGIGGNDLLNQIYNNTNSNGDLSKNIINYLVGSMSNSNNLLDDTSKDNGTNSINTINEIQDISKNDNLSSSIGQLYEALTLLKNAGLKNLVLMNAPDISETPAITQKYGENSIKEVKKAVNLYNNFIQAIFNKISINTNWKMYSLYNELNKAINQTKVKYPKTNYADTNSISEGFDTTTLIPNLTNYGIIRLISNFTFGVNNDNKNNYVFWDIVHPNGWVHKMAYEDMQNLINN